MKSHCDLKYRPSERLGPVISIAWEHISWKTKMGILSQVIIPVYKSVRITEGDMELSSDHRSYQPGLSASYRPELNRSRTCETLAQVLNRGSARGIFSTEVMEVNSGLSSADSVHNEEKIRSHEDPGMVPVSGSWE